MSTMTFDVPAALWLSANARPHWAEKARKTKALRQLGWYVSHDSGLRLDTTHVAAFIGYPRNGKADPANAAPTVKALIDGMVDGGVWPDDDSTHVIGPTFLRDPKPDVVGIYRVRFVLTEQAIPWGEPA